MMRISIIKMFAWAHRHVPHPSSESRLIRHPTKYRVSVQDTLICRFKLNVFDLQCFHRDVTVNNLPLPQSLLGIVLTFNERTRVHGPILASRVFGGSLTCENTNQLHIQHHNITYHQHGAFNEQPAVVSEGRESARLPRRALGKFCLAPPGMSSTC